MAPAWLRAPRLGTCQGVRPTRPFHPIPESSEAADELEPGALDAFGRPRLQVLVALAGRARTLVPELVGVSVARREEGLTFTVLASDEDVAVLDAVQYAAGGPCVQAAEELEAREFHPDDVLDEDRWRLFAQATAARPIRSTLTLPILARTDDGGDGRARGLVVGSVNLYAAASRAFADRHEELAAVFGAFAEGAVADADLGFATREEARRAPGRARDLVTVEIAVGVLAGQMRVDVDTARARLESAAHQAGVGVEALAREIVRHHQGRGGPPA